MTVGIVGRLILARHRMLAVGARSVVRMLQFNGKQEEANAIWSGSDRTGQC